MDRISGGKEKSERGTSASDDPRPWPTYSQKKHSAHPSGCMAASMRVSKNRPRFRISDTAIRIRISYVKNVRRTASILRSGGSAPEAPGRTSPPRHEPADEPSRCGLRVNSVFANITINSDSATCRSVFPRMPQPPPCRSVVRSGAGAAPPGARRGRPDASPQGCGPVRTMKNHFFRRKSGRNLRGGGNSFNFASSLKTKP